MSDARVKIDATPLSRQISARGAGDVPVGYKRTEAGTIPEDWNQSTVGSEFRIQLGKMLDAASNRGVPKPYVGNRRVQWGHVDVDDIETVPLTSVDLYRYRLRHGDLLVCEGGEIGRAAIWDSPIPECYYQKAIHRLRPIGRYNTYLMMSLLRLWASSGYLANYITRTSIAHLPKEKLEIVPLPVPPEPEQRTIAEALSDVDSLLVSLDALIAKKRAIKQATMQQLLTGKTRLPGFSEKWKTRQLRDLGVFSKGRGIRRDDVAFEGLACIRYGELYTVYSNYVVLPVSRIRSEVAETALPIGVGDLLFAGSGETAEEIGRCAAYLGNEPAYAGGDIIVLSPLGHDSLYIGHLMNYSTITTQKARLAQGDAVVHVSARNLSQVEVTLPPSDEQRAIAAVLFDADADIAGLESRRDKTHAIKQGMMQQLLTGRVRLV